MSKKKKSMPVIGLTGGIGMGKSTVAALLREFGLPVYEADKVVHGLLQKGGKAVGPVGRIFAATLERGEINRAELGAIVFASPVKLKALEKILHPLVRRAENEFLRKARRDDAAAAILEIPLLFETGGHKRCDFTLCVTAPKKVQMARVMQRPGMTQTKLKGILSRQLPDAKKRKLADFTIDTGGTRAQTKKQLRAALDTILKD